MARMPGMIVLKRGHGVRVLIRKEARLMSIALRETSGFGKPGISTGNLGCSWLSARSNAKRILGVERALLSWWTRVVAAEMVEPALG
jgi:hypothetical protein